MKLNKFAERGSRGRRSRAPLILSIALTLLAGLGLFRGALIADGGGSGAGGDTVGTLPLLTLPGAPLIDPNGNPMFGPMTPILTLSGPVSEVTSMIVDAYGDGGYVLTWLGNGNARFDFYGHDTIILDRTRFQNSFVKAQIAIGSSFQGALVKISVNDVVRSTHAVTAGTVDTRLRKMAQTGLIDMGVVWHAENAQHVHSVLAFKGSGNLIKIDQRD